MITLYCSFLRPEEKSIVEEMKALGLPFDICLSREGCRKELSNTVVLLRTISHHESQIFSTYFECSNIRSINSDRAIRLCTNKAALAALAESHNIAQPKFKIIFTPAELDDLPTTLGYPFVIKPISSSWGRGVCRVRDTYCLETWVAGRESLDANHRQFPVLAQQFVEKPNYDIRVVVIGKNPVVAFRRVSEHWKTNTHNGARVEPISISEEIRNLIKQIITMLGEGIYGVDLFETTDGKLLLNEVNHNPEFAHSSEVHGVNVARAIAQFAGEVSCAA